MGAVAHRLAHLPQLSSIHNVFHKDVLRNYEPDPFHILEYKLLELREDMTCTEQPI